jgi:hypothetical protein
MEQHMPQKHQTQETKDWGATQNPPEELPVLFLEPGMVAMEHISSVNDMVTTGNEPFSVKLLLFKCISTSLPPLEIKGATESKSYFTTSSSISSSLLFGIIADLLEGYIQKRPLMYPINDLPF